jgi:hypothetical protein
VIAALQQLAALRAWVFAPVASAQNPLPGSVGALDFLLRDPVARSVERGFFAGQAGETLLVAPGESPLAGILLLGYGSTSRGWVDAMQTAFAKVPDALPGTSETVAIFPPAAIGDRIPVAWSKAGDRFMPMLRAKLPKIKHWLWLDLLQDDK